MSPATLFVFVAPAIALLLAFNTFPMVQAVVGSLFDSSIRAGRAGSEFVGLGNFARLFTDLIFADALRATLSFVLVTSAGQTVAGLALALALRTRVRGWVVYQSLLLVPLCLSIVVSLTIWRITMDPRGIINGILAAIGGPRLGFYLDADQALASLSLISIWAWSPFAALIFLAGLRTIDPAILEAAEIDGASAWQRVRRVMLPLLNRATLVVLVVAITGNFIVFAPASLVTKGGPQFSTHFLMWEAWSQFGFNENGLAYAIVVLLLAMATCSVLVLFRLVRRDD